MSDFVTSDGGPRFALPSGLLDVDQATYHADQVADRPTLSKSIIQLLIEKSPAHARHAHPRLNPDFTREEDDKFNLGTAAHSLFLEGDAGVEVCNLIHPKTGELITDWKLGEAQEAKKTARQYGRIPMLQHQYDECQAMVTALRTRCDAHPDGPLFTDGIAERTLVWEDKFGVLCRARLDWLLNDHSAVHDLKSTRASASPEAWSRTALSIGADLQVALYLRGCRSVLGVEPEFKFVVIETQPPFEMSVFALAPDTLALAEKKIDYALELWAKCLRNDQFPGYSTQVAHITTPPYVEAAWLERELREAAA